MATLKAGLRIGFVGQGYVGKNYANDFEARGYEVVRYALEEPYCANRDKIRDCDVVLIAVPTPTTPKGFDGSIVESALLLVGTGKIAVVKSTILPGMTKELQQNFPEITLLFSPEFLREATAAYDAAHPYSIVIGKAGATEAHERAAELLRSVLPPTPSIVVCDSTEAELVKYFQNGIGYIDIVAFNVFYDLAAALGARWAPIHEALQADPNIASRFANPLHKSGRGAGGHCLIKDFAALRGICEKILDQEERSLEMLRTIEEKNKELLTRSGKDEGLVRGVYGDC